MRIDHGAIFNQPDLLETNDEPEVETVTYFATATRTGKQWIATARDLPGGRTVQAQGASWREVKRNMADLVFEIHNDDASIGALHLVPADPDAEAALKDVVAARSARVLAEQAEREAVRHAVRLLIDQGWSTRDIGSALLLSHQRVSQIAPRATTQKL
ncbi:hypothetical protein [Sphaerisporangium sp. TRM90804]|uniref:hypothetical protein n=1 Tax=Sphaerisporangium sp. TRM90804 TaxID=3031113 RepID=UPI00244A586B|nr:hypothetical protein [Sphaerisporangium sp. TRM90804]MDH2426442.1 hypothetical protein [Sphaerisporangium sp. TRM90804]